MELIFSTALPEDAQQLCELYLRYSRELEQCGMEYDLVESTLLGSIQTRIKFRMTLAAVAKDVFTFATKEGLTAHAKSAIIRTEEEA